MAEVSFENKNVLNFDNDELSGYSDNQIIDSATSELSITDASGEITIETTEKKQMQPGLIKYLHYVCTAQATIAKNSVESKAIEIKVKQADLKAIHDCMALINKDANEKGVDIHFNSPAKIEGLDELSRVKANEQQQRVEAILQAAKDAGVDLDETKLNYDFYERGNLIDNLKHLESQITADIKLETTRMQDLVQKSERWISLTNSFTKMIERTNKQLTSKL